MRLAVIATHPIQYYAPWFKYIESLDLARLKVFYLLGSGNHQRYDMGFGKSFAWDIPLLEGYNYCFVKNTSQSPGTHHFSGLINPTLLEKVTEWQPTSVLMLAYNYYSLFNFILRWNSHKCPIIFRGDSHRLGKSHMSGNQMLRRLFISTVFSRFQAFLYVGKANYNYFLYNGVTPQKLFFSPHSIDNTRFIASAQLSSVEALEWRKELNIPISSLVILFAGKFEEKKRPQDLLEAFLRLDPENCYLLFVGSGELEPLLLQRAQNHPRVRFAPFQNQTFMPRTYATADLFVLPSFGPNETWGLCINEAMCLEKPVIVSNSVGCAQDLVSCNQNGLIFNAGNLNSLVDALDYALSNRDRLKQWGKESRKIISGYTYAQSTKGLFDALTYLQK